MAARKKSDVGIDWLLYERAALEEGFTVVCGADEAGRGPLAGPVCAAAVILPPDTVIDGVNDSKKLSPAKREALFDKICAEALSYGIAWASVEEIEQINILNAAMLAMKRAIEMLDPAPQLALIDGNKTPSGLRCEARPIIKGDALSASIAAASILAKVSRDRLLIEFDREYPQYGFAQHKGYGTQQHIDALREYGVCPLHRPSFLKKIDGIPGVTK